MANDTASAGCLPETTPPSPNLPTALPLSASAVSLRDALEVLQCTQCARILREPMTLPCGRSLCRRCLPQPHTRRLVSYPATAEREAGIVCPFNTCRKEHAVFDCGLDYVLGKMVEIVREGLKGAEVVYDGAASEGGGHSAALPNSDHRQLTTMRVLAETEEKGETEIDIEDALVKTRPLIFSVHGTLLQALFLLAEMHGLPRIAKLDISSSSPLPQPEPPSDSSLLNAVLSQMRPEADCQVCYAIFLDPVMTPCGHTFCAVCLHRVLDHTPHCPVCRRSVSIAPLLSSINKPINRSLAQMLETFWPKCVASRRRAAIQEGWTSSAILDSDSASSLAAERVPIFPCSLAFPGIPFFLHIFEPRYRLMVRRCMEGSRIFGMVLPRWMAGDGVAGGSESEEFAAYGTLLRISKVSYFPDGRSMIETVGQGRFKIRSYTWEDGIVMGAIERLHDMGIAEEEAHEAADLGAASAQNYTVPRFADYFPVAPDAWPPASSRRRSLSRAASALEAILSRNTSDSPLTLTDPFSDLPPPTGAQPRPNISAMSTAELLDFARACAAHLSGTSSRLEDTFGPAPTDAALFAWWFAAAMPMSEDKKYALLKSTSVRDRLKMCCMWALEWEGARWSVPRCVIM
ncbi:LON peptidase N-terminal domain and RING finger protein 1 [Ceratocystis lukuohia]|uniref:LON peptidase N-terminal domain and RING finger protein 1 n=1 Tax=Ceratocystis lukuohia TaxID=2019550 RepID=A0ABR4MQK0_9PEZI